MLKKSLCFIAYTEGVCDYVQQEMLRFLDNYLNVETWCLERTKVPPKHFSSHDLYLVSSNTWLPYVKSFAPSNKELFVAARTLNTENLCKLLDLEPGTDILVVGTNHETCWLVINLIKSFGLNYLNLHPYYPEIGQFPQNITLGITTGLKDLMPPQVDKVIDIGVKGLDVSTFARIIQYFDIPPEILDNISHAYLEALLLVTQKQQKTARRHEDLKQNVEDIINTVNEALIAINTNHEITFFNNEAEKIFNSRSEYAIGKAALSIIPELNFPDNLEDLEPLTSEIQTINDKEYVIILNPMSDSTGLVTGAIATLKPVKDVQDLESKVRVALKKKGNVAKHTFMGIAGDSPAIHHAIGFAKNFAQSELTILLEGESGTGKELFAQAIHNYSHRKNSPFVALNFAALADNLVESELFGYEEGAFTGAKRGGKRGLFEDAHTGTMFLDEIGDATLEVQKKLLRVLEEREIRRIGGSTVIPVDVRIIAATNRNLETLVKEGKFRSDLFYRLCSLPINLPPLRERKNDVLLLFSLISRRVFKGQIELDSKLSKFLINYDWPGNVRELENVVKYITSVAKNKRFATLDDLPPYLLRDDKKITEKFEKAHSHPGIENSSFVQVINALNNNNSLELVFNILYETRNNSLVNKGIGRQNMLKVLQTKMNDLTDHRIKQCLMMLEHMGYIQSGIKRQGSRITKQGADLLNYLEHQQYFQIS
jgi:sigma-54 dependent transcriptional regulator, acetoin dehydrogenase operon transcriptional activator AcoR